MSVVALKMAGFAEVAVVTCVGHEAPVENCFQESACKSDVSVVVGTEVLCPDTTGNSQKNKTNQASG